jgi:hypothetical protein
VKNISATSPARWRFAGLKLTTLLAGVGLIASTAWSVWATERLLELERREVVTVQLNRLVGEFVEGEARAGRSPDETRARIAGYLAAVERSVASLGRDGRTVLIAEAVVAGSARDATPEVRADVARRLGEKTTGGDGHDR